MNNKMWTVYAVIIATLFWLSWLTFCVVTLTSEDSLWVVGGQVAAVSAFLLWNALVGIYGRRKPAVMIALLVALPVGLLVFRPVLCGQRMAEHEKCWQLMRDTPLLEARGMFDKIGLRRWYFECPLCRSQQREGEKTYHVRVDLPLEGAERCFYVVSHVKMTEPLENPSPLCSYEAWKKSVNDSLFRTPLGGQAVAGCQDRTVMVIYAPAAPESEMDGETLPDSVLRFWMGDAEYYPLSAQRFQSFVEKAETVEQLRSDIRHHFKQNLAGTMIASQIVLLVRGVTLVLAYGCLLGMVWRMRNVG